MKRRRLAGRPKPKKKVTLPALPKIGRRGKIALIAIAIFVFVLSPAVMFGATRLENQNSFCASCHTEGEQTFYNQSLAAAPVDLASFHELKNASRCIDCHTGQGVMGRVGGLMAGASDLVSFASGHYPQPAIQDTPISDANCLKCHANIADKQDMSNHFHIYLARWQTLDPAGGGSCVACHAGHNLKGDAQIMYLNKEDAGAVCQRCHTATGGGG